MVAEAEGDDGDVSGPRPEKEGASAISFDKSVKADVAATLRRLHQNLGHPAVSDLVRHLRLAGASPEVIKGAKSLSCETCKRCHGPRSARPASQPKLAGVDMKPPDRDLGL